MSEVLEVMGSTRLPRHVQLMAWITDLTFSARGSSGIVKMAGSVASHRRAHLRYPELRLEIGVVEVPLHLPLRTDRSTTA